MRDVLQTEELDIPEGVTLNIKSRLITVEGPRGKLVKNVRHVNMDIQLIKAKTNKVLLAVWQGGRKHVACLRTIKSLIQNMITGVTKVTRLFGFINNVLICTRVSPIKCVQYMPTSPSIASFRIMDRRWRSGISWARRSDIHSLYW